jgi:dTDP-4-amino-4,6-dideoxygalactose transaminase
MTGSVATRIPLVDLELQHREIAAEVTDGWSEVLASKAFVLGPQVQAFEDEFARHSGVSHCIGVASGTDALELALRALGVGTGDEVILPANTFVATAAAAARAGATPVLVDCDRETHLIDPEAVAPRVGPRTRALVPVHLFGQIAPVELLPAEQVPVLEDAAQSQGARRRRRPSGSLGAAAATSFYPGKNIGAYGDAGAVVTNDDAVASRLRALRNYGSERKYEHPETGFNSRLDSLQAVVLSAKLRRLDAWNDLRREAAARYDEMLADVESVKGPKVLEGNEHVWHLYVVRVPERDEVLRQLHEAGIEAGVHYPVPIHLQGAFAYLGHKPGDFPEAERAAGEILSLPIYPGITADQQERVVEALRRALP